MNEHWTLLPVLLLLLVAQCIRVDALFEDQIGKFDWRQQYVGKVTHAFFDAGSSGKRIVVGTERNVIASLSSSSGKLQWRQILGSADQGGIVHLAPAGDGRLAAVSSAAPAAVRVFDAATGLLVWEALAPASSESDGRVLFAGWSNSGADPVHLRIARTSSDDFFSLTATVYEAEDGASRTLEPASLPWLTAGGVCAARGGYVACADRRTATLSLFHVETADLRQASLSELGLDDVTTVDLVRGNVPGLVSLTSASQGVAVLDAELTRLAGLPANAAALDATLDGDADGGRRLLAFVSETSRGARGLGLYDVGAGRLLVEHSGELHLADHYGDADLLVAQWATRSGSGPTLRYLLSTRDHGLIYGSRQDVFWNREESLASITKVEMVDLPLSAMDASIEDEFGRAPGLVRRLTSQLRQLVGLAASLASSTTAFDKSHDKVSNSGLVRDRFGLHKLVIAVTRPGKVLAIDSLTGRVVWQRLPWRHLVDADDAQLTLLVQRTSAHYALEPQCLVVASRRGHPSSLFAFQPVTGRQVALLSLDYAIDQVMLISASDETEFLKPLLLLDAADRVHVYPDTAPSRRRLADAAAGASLFLYTADRRTCVMRGLAIRSTQQDGVDEPTAVETWRLELCPAPADAAGDAGDADGEPRAHRIGAVVARHPDEKVHSVGRVLADRSVLYKYLNPNLVVVTTEGWHAQHRGYLNVYLVDVVSGGVVFSASHRRVGAGAVHVVHAENWVVYAFYNDKYRRTEVASLELFEGKRQGNSTDFSSFEAPQPLVDRQAYIYPAHITAMKDTFSEKGMTAKHILLGVSNGWIQELPRAFVDPRRPVVAAASAEMREEGVLPYVPELPIPPDAIINYNQTVHDVRAIHTTHSALESTCLVFAYGLDLFFTHVTPSRTFDVLSDDFEYFFIGAVLGGLMLASFVTRRLASKKALRQAWK